MASRYWTVPQTARAPFSPLYSQPRVKLLPRSNIALLHSKVTSDPSRWQKRGLGFAGEIGAGAAATGANARRRCHSWAQSR